MNDGATTRVTPTAADVIGVQTGRTETTLEFAGFGRRFSAFLIDLVILSGILVLTALTLRLLMATGIWWPNSAGRDPNEAWSALSPSDKTLVITSFVLSLGPLYFGLCHAGPWQATIGKRLQNICVTDVNGERISNSRSFYRWLARWILGWFGGSILSGITILGRERKALHDYLAKTQVVCGRRDAGRHQWWRIAVGLAVPFLSLLGSLLATL